MLDFGFEHFPLVEIAKQEQPVQNMELVTGRGFKYPLAKGEEEGITKKLILFDKRSPAAVTENEQFTDPSFGLAGRIEMQLKGEPIGSIPVYSKGSYIPPEPSIADATLGGIGEQQLDFSLESGVKSTVITIILTSGRNDRCCAGCDWEG